MTTTPCHIPRLETERLTLRAPIASDLGALALFLASPRGVWVGGPKTRHEAWRGLLSMVGHWSLRGYGFWHVVERASGISVGNVGFINHEGWAEAELAWHVYDGFEGKGYAFEAATAARNYGAQHFGLNAPISYIDPENARSLALAKRLGATFERAGTVIDHACHIYRHPTLALKQEAAE